MTIYLEGWEPSTGPGDTSAVSGETLYRFGLRNNRALTLKEEVDHDIQTINKLGQWYHDLSVGNNPAESVIAHFIPVNGIPFYHMLGKATQATKDQKYTITNMDLTTARKPRYNTVKQVDSEIPDVTWANVCHDLSVRYEGGNVVCTQVSRAEQAEPEDITPETPVFPDAGDEANDHEGSAFNVQKYFKWDGDEIDATMVEFRATHNTSPSMGSTGQYEAISEAHNIGAAFTVMFAGTNTALKTDFKAQAAAKEARWYCQKANNSDHYFEVVASGYCKALKSQELSGDVVFTTASFILGQVTVTSQDFIDGSVFYGCA